MKLAPAKYSADGSSEEGCWALLKDLARGVGSDQESQEEEGRGYGEGDEEADEEEEKSEEEDGVDDAEPVERAKGQSRGKHTRVALGVAVASTAQSSTRACLPTVCPINK